MLEALLMRGLENWWEEMDHRLYDAAVAGDVKSLFQLIEEDPLLLDKASLNCQDKNPLHIAAMLGHVDFVKAILQDNSDMCFVPDRFGRNPFHLTAIKGRLDVLQELINARPLVAREKTAGGDTALHLSIKYNQLEALKYLVETIKDHEFVNMKNGDGMTVLHLAICNTQNETIEHLLETNIVDVNAQNANGQTALDLFQGDTHSDIARSLNTAGAKKANEIDASAARNAPKGIEWLTEKREALMVVASLIATMAFQAGVTPPGGVWQDDLCSNDPKWSNDFKCSNETIPHAAGKAVMATTQPRHYRYFVRVNTVAFVSSLSIILLLISGLPFQRNKFFTWILTVVMWMIVATAALTYCASFIMVTPKSNMDRLSHVTGTAISVWSGVMVILLLGNTIRLLNRWLKFPGIDLLKHRNWAVQEKTDDMQENIQMSSV